jgi:hypothetical protein
MTASGLRSYAAIRAPAPPPPSANLSQSRALALALPLSPAAALAAASAASAATFAASTCPANAISTALTSTNSCRQTRPLARPPKGTQKKSLDADVA